jgi:alpha-glucosidase
VSVLRSAGLACAAAVLCAAPAAAGWASLGAMSAPKREAGALVFRNEQGIVSVSVLAPEIVRVRFSATPGFGRDHSYAVVRRDFGDPRATFETGATRSLVSTSALRVTIAHDPFRITVADAAGGVLDEDDPERGIAFTGTTTRVWKRLRDEDRVYGFGEKTGRLDKRGWKLGGYTYAMWNSDTYGYEGSTDPIYAAVPFFMVLREGKAHGIFLDNTHRTLFDVGKESQSLLSFGAEGGELDYYVIQGPHPRSVVERYTALTGRIPMPPRWALGYHQCRYSYYPEAKVRLIADTFRVKRIPADVIWLDIHYQDDYKPFTWNRERFPDPPRLIGDLRRQGFRTVTILDPHPARQPGMREYDSGLAGDHFVKNPDGSVYTAPVWPSQGEKDPRPSVFPDFSKPAARDWWGSLYKPLLDMGVAGIWNDMNEPAIFETITGTMPLDVRHDNEGQPTDHREIHNVYGLLMTRATYEGLLRLRPKERPFVLTRATFAGGQRYAALWPGDNLSEWDHLRTTIPMLAGLGLSGFSFVGSDIGGFGDFPTAELFTRWIQTGVFYPFMRTHTTFGTPDQEPWSYGTYHEALNRRAIELRYELLPTVYNVMREASETGLPALRPLVLEHPDDPATWGRDDSFLFGRDLLVAPVLRAGETSREVYLPEGDWYDFWTARRYEGRKGHRLAVTLESLPVFVRGGAFVFRQPVVQHTGEMPGQPLQVWVYPAPSSEASLYEDDGETLDYQRGAFLRRRFSQSREGRRVTVEVGAPEGSWRPAPRELVLRILAEGEPARVTVGSRALPRLAADAWARTAEGWMRAEDGFVVVKGPDAWTALQVTLEP